MKLSTVSSLIALSTVLAAGAYQFGCSGGPAAPLGGPPPPPGNGTQPTSTVETFAIKTLYLGESARSCTAGNCTSGAASANAWKNFGYNLDGKVTTKTSTDVCNLLNMAPKDNQVDGTNGIDNAFGAVILPIIQTAAGLNTPSQTISTAIDNGSFTIMIQITGFDDTPTQNATGLAGQIFAGGKYGATAPTFDMNTDWPVSPQLLNDMMTIGSGSKVQFKQNNVNSGYVNNGTFVSGDLTKGGVTISISLVFQGVPLTLSVHSAVLTFNHGKTTTDANGANTTAIAADGTQAQFGTIAGVINTDELITGLQSVAGRISPSLCGPAFMGIEAQLKQASDIIVDPTTGAVSNAAGKDCNGISIGLGFDAVEIKNPDMVAFSDAGAPPDPCAMDSGTMDTGTQDTGSQDTGSGDATGQ